MRSPRTAPHEVPSTIKPPFGERAKAVTPRSISPPSRTTSGLNSTPNDDAADWITANMPIPAGLAASRMTAARVTLGAICLSSSSHFPLRLYSYTVKPVALPPGRAKLSTKPAPTGSATFTKHDGDSAGRLLQCHHARGGRRQDDVRRKRDQFSRVSTAVGIVGAPACVDAHVAAVGPAKLL